MKKKLIILLFLIICTCFSTHAQIEELNRSTLFNKCEITYTDGKVKEGIIAYFLDGMAKDIDDMMNSSIENILNFDDNSFEFKESISSNPIVMTQKNIDNIKIYYSNDEVQVYKLMNIRTLNENGIVINSSKKAWLPVIKDDIISLYQKNV